MAQKYVNVKEAARMLGTSEAQVKEMLDRRELHGYRDGADWKFKIEEIEKAANDRAPAAPAEEDSAEDVLLSEVELGGSELGTSGTVIGMENRNTAAESDIRLAESDVRLAESDIRLDDSKPAAKPAVAKEKKDEVDSKVSQFEELDLALDEDLTLDDSAVGSAAATPKPSDSAVNLTGKQLDDDDLVLGGSGTGSDVTIGGDSGISLVDPADSGLNLEGPLNLANAGEESLELGEDDLMSYSSDTEAPTSLKSEDDFQLTPMEDSAEGDDSESGSQVIALDTEGEGSEAATMIASGAAGGGVAAMLDEDLSFEPAMGLGVGVPLAAPDAGDLAVSPAAMAAAGLAMMPATSTVLPEAPYSVWDIISLIVCLMVLVLAGMMMYDILQNMWSWNGTHGVNTPLMDWIVGLFGDK
jgi:excisionase family DNA binding protein